MKMHKRPLSNKPVPRATRIGEVFHTDLKGPFQIRSIHHHHYWMIIIDDFSSMYWIYFLHNKFEAFQRGFRRWYQHVYLKFSNKPCIMTMDSGGEFLSNELQDWFQTSLIEPHWLPAHAPSMNGMVENCHKRLLRVVNAALHYANLPNNLWDEVAQSCRTIHLKSPCKPDYVSPLYLWTGQHPTTADTHVIGAECYNHDPVQSRGSLKDKGEKLQYIGTREWSSNSHTLYRPSTGKLIHSRNVVFIDKPLLMVSPYKNPSRNLLDNSYQYIELVPRAKVPEFEARLPGVYPHYLSNESTATASASNNEFCGVINVGLLRRQTGSADHQDRSATNNDIPKKREDAARKLGQPCRVPGTSNSPCLTTEDAALEAIVSEGKDDSLDIGQALLSDEDTRRMKITFAVNNHQLFYSDRTKVSDSFLSRHGSLEVYDQTQENGARNGSPGVDMNQESYGSPLSDSVASRMLRSINQPQQDETWDSLEYTSSSLVDMPKHASLTSRKRRRPALSDRHYDVDPGTGVGERQIGDQSAHQVVGMDTVDVVPTMVIQGDPVAENHDLDVHFECTEQTSGIVEPEARGETCSNRPRAALASASCAMRGRPQRSAHSRRSQLVEQNPHLMMNLLLMAICTDFQCSVLHVLLVESEIDPDDMDVAFNAEPKTHTEALRHPAADDWVAGEEEEIGSEVQVNLQGEEG